jgi:peptide/nickel transport system substrate-binding protein
VGRRGLLILFLGLAAACSREKRTTPATDTAVAIADDTPQDGGTLIRRLDIDVVTVNPVIATSRYDRYVDHYLFTPIVYLDRNLQPVPGLAKSWTISDDGLLYRFDLNPKATFSDGTPVLASDVVFTLKKIIDPASNASQVSGSFEHLDLTRTHAVDEHTVEIAFKEPLATQLTRFIDLMPVPEHVYGKGNFRNDYNSTAVGSGPYRLVRRDPGKQIILVRRDDYWREKPHIQTIVFKLVTDYGTAWSALKLGEIDETILPADIWLRERANTANAEAIDFQRFYTLSYNYIAWNEHLPLFSDKRVRRALSMCVPLDAIVQDLYHGTARAMSGPFTPDEYAYNPTVPVVRYDPEEARRIFAATGWKDADGDGVLEKDGRKFAFDLLIFPGSATTKQFAQMVQAEMKKAGVAVEIRTLDGTAAIDGIGKGNYQAVYLGWDLDPDPDPYALFHSSQVPPAGQNFVFYSNPEADRIIIDARKEFDQSKRKALYWRLHEILAEDQPYTWTIQPSLKWAISKRLRGVTTSAGYGLYLWYPGELGWWIPREYQNRARVHAAKR